MNSELSVYAKFGLEYMIWPFKDSSVNWISVFKLIPLPRKIFSTNWPPDCKPSLPTPAAIDISPVGCSSTIISTIFKLSLDPSDIFVFTDLKNPKDLISFTDLLNKRLFSGSPSSIINLFLITSSIVV